MFDSCRNLTYGLTHQIGAAIIRGSYSINKNFPTEAELSIEFNISRNVTREAIKMLTAKGLIASRPRKGITVMPVDHWNMFDPDVLAWTLSARPVLDLLKEFTQLRIAIEPEAARLAAENRHDKIRMDAIWRALEKMNSSHKCLNLNEFLNADIDFHTAILAASKNPYFLQMRQFIRVALQTSVANTNQLKGMLTAKYHSHQIIFDEINNGNGEAAAGAVRALLNEIMVLINESIETGNDI